MNQILGLTWKTLRSSRFATLALVGSSALLLKCVWREGWVWRPVEGEIEPGTHLDEPPG
jgi:hypothetical protein